MSHVGMPFDGPARALPSLHCPNNTCLSYALRSPLTRIQFPLVLSHFRLRFLSGGGGKLHAAFG